MKKTSSKIQICFLSLFFCDYILPNCFSLLYRTVELIASLPSPRILNGHELPCLLPTQIFTKKVKVIHVMRNPKDVAVSFFHFAMNLRQLIPIMETKPFETFSEFLPYFTGEYGVCK